MDLEKKKDKSSDRELIQEFITLVENDTTEKDPQKLIQRVLLN